jgi:hypothetical protein
LMSSLLSYGTSRRRYHQGLTTGQLGSVGSCRSLGICAIQRYGAMRTTRQRKTEKEVGVGVVGEVQLLAAG